MARVALRYEMPFLERVTMPAGWARWLARQSGGNPALAAAPDVDGAVTWDFAEQHSLVLKHPVHQVAAEGGGRLGQSDGSQPLFQHDGGRVVHGVNLVQRLQCHDARLMAGPHGCVPPVLGCSSSLRRISHVLDVHVNGLDFHADHILDRAGDLGLDLAADAEHIGLWLGHNVQSHAHAISADVNFHAILSQETPHALR